MSDVAGRRGKTFVGRNFDGHSPQDRPDTLSRSDKAQARQPASHHPFELLHSGYGALCIFRHHYFPFRPFLVNRLASSVKRSEQVGFRVPRQYAAVRTDIRPGGPMLGKFMRISCVGWPDQGSKWPRAARCWEWPKIGRRCCGNTQTRKAFRGAMHRARGLTLKKKLRRASS